MVFDENGRRLAYTPREAAELTGLHINTIYELVRKGSIPSRRVGTRKILIPRHGLARWLNGDDSAEAFPIATRAAFMH